MITDACKHVRELGVRRIMRARASKQPQRGVRILEIPLINCEAEYYIQLIDWQQCKLTELPLSKSISDLYLEGFVHGGETPVIEFARFPCHTQAVERCVKGATEASLYCSFVAQDARDGFIRARISARMIMPTFNTKNEYRTSAPKD